ncbi:hypothetical protein ABTQ08_20775, partial [Acinetobacter baumannii]
IACMDFETQFPACPLLVRGAGNQPTVVKRARELVCSATNTPGAGRSFAHFAKINYFDVDHCGMLRRHAAHYPFAKQGFMKKHF